MNNSRIEELESLCSEAYLVIVALAFECDKFDNSQIVKILDNLSEHKLIHTDVLPLRVNDDKK